MNQHLIEEAQSRLGTTTTKADSKRKIKNLDKQRQKNIEDERRKVNLLSDDAFKQEQEIILSRRAWLSQEIAREQLNLINLETYTIRQENVNTLKPLLQHNLDNATFDDWVLIRDTLVAKVLSFGDGTWDVLVNVPAQDRSIANTTPWNV